jgi:3-hydroxyacyl-CoA dehydrogenase
MTGMTDVRRTIGVVGTGVIGAGWAVRSVSRLSVFLTLV